MAQAPGGPCQDTLWAWEGLKNDLQISQLRVGGGANSYLNYDIVPFKKARIHLVNLQTLS